VEKVFVIGASGHAKVVIDIIEKQGVFRIAGLIDRFKPKGESVFRYPILGAESDLPDLMPALDAVGGVVAIGDNWLRSEAVARIKQVMPGFRFVSAVHPSAQIGRGVSIGAGTVVMAGVVINADTVIGEHCIVNTHASLDHDNWIGDFVTIAPHAATGGNVQIQNYSVLSLGAKIVHGIHIGEHTVIGAGATVLDDLPGYVVAFGTPARVQRPRQAGERYL